MTTCLTKGEIDECASAIREAFRQLLERPAFAPRPGKRQWDFFRHCFEVLMGARDGDFPCEIKKIGGYKFEISQKLDWHYSNGMHHQFTFLLNSTRFKHEYMDAGADYPSCNQYMLLVFRTDRAQAAQQELHDLLSRAVELAVTAEFAAYLRLPKKKPILLEKYFAADGPAYQRIQHNVERHFEAGEVISNEGNPSWKLLKTLSILKADEQRAEVKTTEHWYLRWWSTSRHAYAARPYVGVNRQHYTLIKRDERWLVWSNHYRRPKRPRPSSATDSAKRPQESAIRKQQAEVE